MLQDRSMEKVWQRAKLFFPNLPSRGQIEIIRGIYFSIQEPTTTYMTKAEANKWKDEFVKKSQELQSMWMMMPENILLNIDLGPKIAPHIGICLEEEFWAQTDEDELLRGDRINLIVNISRGDLILAHAEAVQDADYFQTHLGQVRGDRAERLYFVRGLSQSLAHLTGQYKRDIVATITRYLFECNFSASDVVRATKGLEHPEKRAQLTDEKWLEILGGDI